MRLNENVSIGRIEIGDGIGWNLRTEGRERKREDWIMEFMKG